MLGRSPPDQRASTEVAVNKDPKEVLGSKARKVFNIKSCDLPIDAVSKERLTTFYSVYLSSLDKGAFVHALPFK